MVRAECYRAVEQALERRGYDYEIHGLPGADDIVHFEEYWLSSMPESTKLFPAILDAESDEARQLDGMIVRAVQQHAAADDTSAYRVVLCGEGWTDERVEALVRQVTSRLRTGIRLTIQTLDEFTDAG